MQRNERFSKGYMQTLDQLLEILFSYILNKCKEKADETKELNKSVAEFLKVIIYCFLHYYKFNLKLLFRNAFLC